jgi:hypothetical protein
LTAALLGLLFTFSNTEGGAFDEGDIGMMGEPVEQGGNAGGIGEDGVPVFESEV